MITYVELSECLIHLFKIFEYKVGADEEKGQGSGEKKLKNGGQEGNAPQYYVKYIDF